MHFVMNAVGVLAARSRPGADRGRRHPAEKAPAAGRGAVEDLARIRLIDDAFNANPTSMRRVWPDAGAADGRPAGRHSGRHAGTGPGRNAMHAPWPTDDPPWRWSIWCIWPVRGCAPALAALPPKTGASTHRTAADLLGASAIWSPSAISWQEGLQGLAHFDGG